MTEKDYKNTYILKNIPPELWKQAKHKALDEGISLRDLIIKAIEKYVVS